VAVCGLIDDRLKDLECLSARLLDPTCFDLA
jgi:hypothetical protein